MNEEERQIKYLGATSLEAVAELLSRGCRVLQKNELEVVTEVVRHAMEVTRRVLEGQDGSWESLVINAVVLTDLDIERGASWTVGTTMILSDVRSAAHETVHILQRLSPDVFSELYLRTGPFRRLPRDRVVRLAEHFYAIDNPDASWHEADPWALQREKNRRLELVLYDANMRRMMIELDPETLEVVAASDPLAPVRPYHTVVSSHGTVVSSHGPVVDPGAEGAHHGAVGPITVP